MRADKFISSQTPITKSYKDRKEAEAAYMEYLHRNGMDVQGGVFASWATPNMSTESPSSMSLSEGTNYGSGDIRNTLLSHSGALMLKLYPSPSFKATGACKLCQGTQVQLYNLHTAYSEKKLETSVMGPKLNHVVDGGSSLLWHRLRQ
ncbi:hypothetical protein SO802_008392 [Lithocarpus litseifolius]|uniref:Uncharacterized protein n=1 Tax=Lithocarpus litseifolius TaxID=425828 RepID=A0AAW2DCC0_9ROSI